MLEYLVVWFGVDVRIFFPVVWCGFSVVFAPFSGLPTLAWYLVYYLLKGE
jgi:hypothetical protein